MSYQDANVPDADPFANGHGLDGVPADVRSREHDAEMAAAQAESAAMAQQLEAQQEQLTRLFTATVVASDGERIGKVGQVYLDDQTQEPNWVTVKTGMFGTKEFFIPLDHATLDGKQIVVPYPKQLVLSAPATEIDQNLSPEEEDALYRHYQVAGRRAAPDEPAALADAGEDAAAPYPAQLEYEQEPAHAYQDPDDGYRESGYGYQNAENAYQDPGAYQDHQAPYGYQGYEYQESENGYQNAEGAYWETDAQNDQGQDGDAFFNYPGQPAGYAQGSPQAPGYTGQETGGEPSSDSSALQRGGHALQSQDEGYSAFRRPESR